MSKSYPIWCVVNAPNYNSSKSYGTSSYTTIDVKIGTSRVNSFDFVSTEVRKTVLDEVRQTDLDGQELDTYSADVDNFVSTEVHLFEFLVDGVVVKKTYYDPKTKKILYNVVEYK